MSTVGALEGLGSIRLPIATKPNGIETSQVPSRNFCAWAKFAAVGAITYIHGTPSDHKPNRKISFYPRDIKGQENLVAQITIIGGPNRNSVVAEVARSHIFVIESAKDGPIQLDEVSHLDQKGSIFWYSVPIIECNEPVNNGELETITSITLDLTVPPYGKRPIKPTPSSVTLQRDI